VSVAPDPQRAGSWTDRARCLGRTSLFFATDELSERLAVAVCARCPVRRQCEADVRATEPGGVRHGVVAGYTPEQRRSWSRSG
jgi:hypothetical protein